MKQNIYFEGVDAEWGSLFWVERVYPDAALYYFPQRLEVSQVIDTLSEDGLVEGLTINSIEQVEPERRQGEKGRLAVRANLQDEENRSFAYSLASWALETRFNPGKQTWYANYAGRLHRPENPALFVVTNGDSQTLRDFLEQDEIVDGVNTIPDIADLNFQIRGELADWEPTAALLLNSYGRYVLKKVEADYGPGALA